jgi:hypothetical protein
MDHSCCKFIILVPEKSSYSCKKVVREIEGLILNTVIEELVPVDLNDSYIKLDRVWVLEDRSNIGIRKLTKKPPHTAIPFAVHYIYGIEIFLNFDI